MGPRKLFTLTTWILFFNSGVFGQEFSKAEIVRHKIKTITFLDDQGKVKKVNQYNADGLLASTGVSTLANLRTDQELIYNDHKLLIEERNFNPLGNLHFTHKFTYNPRKQLIKKEAIDSKNQVESTWEYEYNDDGLLVRETQTSATLGNNFTKYKYEKRKVVEEETENNELGKEEKITFSYNDRGHLEEQKIKSYFSNTTTIIKFTYDAHGRLIQQEETTDKQPDGQTIFEYSDDGLLRKQIIKSIADGVTEETHYQYEFY